MWQHAMQCDVANVQRSIAKAINELLCEKNIFCVPISTA